MQYLIKDGTKSHIAVIVLKWAFTLLMLRLTAKVIPETVVGAIFYLAAGVLMNPLLVKNQKHKLWVVIAAVLMYLLVAPRLVDFITTGDFLYGFK